ncbi:uncharacterized protein BKA78DRAFT_16537 [Phyllosticta capitalensis]|uniref:uncharacterized protein n=1 Tax=Phyllosticta capitalensis TaxID=121624 RepID=UPI0031321E0D
MKTPCMYPHRQRFFPSSFQVPKSYEASQNLRLERHSRGPWNTQPPTSPLIASQGASSRLRNASKTSLGGAIRCSKLVRHPQEVLWSLISASPSAFFFLLYRSISPPLRHWFSHSLSARSISLLSIPSQISGSSLRHVVSSVLLEPQVRSK